MSRKLWQSCNFGPWAVTVATTSSRRRVSWVTLHYLCCTLPSRCPRHPQQVYKKRIKCQSFRFLGFDTLLKVPRMGSAQTSSRFQFSQSWNTWLSSIKVEDVIVVAMTKYNDKPFVHFQLNKIQLKLNKEPYILFLAAQLAPQCSTVEWEMSDKWLTSKITLWMLLKTFPVNHVFKVTNWANNWNDNFLAL